MRFELKRCRAGPGTLHDNVLEAIIDQLANPGAAIDMGDDLQKIVGLLEGSAHGNLVQGFMLEAHGAGGYPHRPVVEGANESIPLHAQGRLGILLRKSPQLATAIDRWAVIQEHGVAIATLLAIE